MHDLSFCAPPKRDLVVVRFACQPQSASSATLKQRTTSKQHHHHGLQFRVKVHDGASLGHGRQRRSIDRGISGLCRSCQPTMDTHKRRGREDSVAGIDHYRWSSWHLRYVARAIRIARRGHCLRANKFRECVADRCALERAATTVSTAEQQPVRLYAIRHTTHANRDTVARWQDISQAACYRTNVALVHVCDRYAVVSFRHLHSPA